MYQLHHCHQILPLNLETGERCTRIGSCSKTDHQLNHKLKSRYSLKTSYKINVITNIKQLSTVLQHDKTSMRRIIITINLEPTAKAKWRTVSTRNSIQDLSNVNPQSSTGKILKLNIYLFLICLFGLVGFYKRLPAAASLSNNSNAN